MKTRTLSGGGVEFVRRYLSLILSEGYGRMALWFYLIIVGAKNSHAFINKHTVQHLIRKTLRLELTATLGKHLV
jgi:hypothetical protein